MAHTGSNKSNNNKSGAQIAPWFSKRQKNKKAKNKRVKTARKKNRK